MFYVYGVVITPTDTYSYRRSPQIRMQHQPKQEYRMCSSSSSCHFFPNQSVVCAVYRRSTVWNDRSTAVICYLRW